MSQESPPPEDQIDGKEDPEAQIDAGQEPEDAEVDIVGGNRAPSKNPPAIDDDPDATECSSSFAETDPESEEISKPRGIDIPSLFATDSDDSISPNVSEEEIREGERELTDHWRRHVRPLEWRCKWMELKIKDMDLEAAKYDAKVLAIEDSYQRALPQQLKEGECSKIAPLNEQFEKNKILERRKRESAEGCLEPDANTAERVVASYLETQKRSEKGCPAEDEGPREPVSEEFGEEELRDFECEDLYEVIMEEIEEVQLEVQWLRGLVAMQVDNEQPFSSTDDNELEALSGDTISTSNRDEGRYTEEEDEVQSTETLGSDLVDLELQDEVRVPDVVESTVGHRRSAEVTQQPPFVDDKEDMNDNIDMATLGEVESMEEDDE